MATLLLSAFGSLFGGPLGGAIGALVGRTVDRAIIGSPTREGPRLKELAVSTSSYGSSVPRVHGRMRVPGTIIWATDLIEHRDKQGGGKGKPSVVSYSYSASLAVALSSRPLSGVGRIWADGNLLRGEAGDLKTGGKMRFYSGGDDQSPDPLLAAAEGDASCPAYRGLSYVVFEDLQLGDFGNRIPALTFEVHSDEGVLTLASLVDGVLEDVSSDLVLDGVLGLSCESSLSDLLGQIEPAFPLNCDVSGDLLSLSVTPDDGIIELADPAMSVADDAFGGASGATRRREPPPVTRPEVLRYYDADRDFQPSQQRAPGRPGLGQPGAVELPVAMAAPAARLLAEKIARRAGWSRQTVSWRSAELDLRVRPGGLVSLAEQPGIWRVSDWEWRETGIELALVRAFETSLPEVVANGDGGRLSGPIDVVAGQTVLHAFELPWDGSGSGDSPAIFAALSSVSAGWTGAALFVDKGDGQLVPIGTAGRAKSTLGRVADPLQAASPHLFDRRSQVTVTLTDPGQILAGASVAQLAGGANRAIVGDEMIQFASASSLGGGQWRLEGLLRGRAGTEAAIAGHEPDEAFVLLDDTIVPLDASSIGDGAASEIVALGLGDETPVRSPIANRGIFRRPLFPVHPKITTQPGDLIDLEWTRRSRGAWEWRDGVDVPLNEQSEAYEIRYGDSLVWNTAVNALAISQSPLVAAGAGLPLTVRQLGTFAKSAATLFE